MATLELAEHGMAGPLTCGASHVNVVMRVHIPTRLTSTGRSLAEPAT